MAGRYNNLSVGPAANPGSYYSVGYTYDGTGRPSQVLGVTYTYVSNSHLLSTATDTWSSSSQTRTYLPTSDTLDTIEGKWNSTTKAKFDYGHDAMHRITSVARTGELYARYGNGTQGLDGTFGYNDRSEVTAEVTKLGGSSTVLTGRDDSYAFDLLGNRKTATHNGNGATYTADSLNRYTQRSVPGIFDVAGAASTSATVTVNGSNSGVSRHGEYFFKGHGVSNSPNPVSTTLAVSDGTTTTNVPAFVAGTPEAFTYDLDGNLTGDGHWIYIYDGENRLIWTITSTAAAAAGYPNIAANMSYDYLGRRVFNYHFVWGGSSWVYTGQQERYLYDGWNILYQLDGSTNRVKLYAWGLDLSGSVQEGVKGSSFVLCG